MVIGMNYLALLCLKATAYVELQLNNACHAKNNSLFDILKHSLLLYEI